MTDDVVTHILNGSPWALTLYLLFRNHQLSDKYAALVGQVSETLTRLLERTK